MKLRPVKIPGMLVCGLAAGMAFGQAAATPQAEKPAQTTSAGADAAAAPAVSREDVMRFFAAVRLQQQMEDMEKSVAAQNRESIEKIVEEETAGSEIPPEKRAKIHAFVKKSFDEALKVYPVQEMLNDLIPIYQKYLTKKEIDAAVEFYQSPEGQEILDKGPVMMRDGMAIILPKIQTRMEAQTKKMEREMEEMLQEPTSTPGAPKGDSTKPPQADPSKN